MPLESVTDRKQGRMPLSQHTTEGGIAIGNLGQLRVGSLSLNSERLTHDNQTHKRLKWVNKTATLFNLQWGFPLK